MRISHTAPDARLADIFLPPDASPTLFLLTGPLGCGKTTLCQRLADVAGAQDLNIGGVISPAVIVEGRKTGIDLQLWPHGQRRRLAMRRAQPQPTAYPRHWRIDADTLAWGNQHLSQLTPPDLLLIDELGPLELLEARGLTAAFKLIQDRAWRWAVVVVRPNLVAEAQSRWPWAQIITFSPAGKP